MPPQNLNIRALLCQETLDVGRFLTLKMLKYLLIIFLRIDARWSKHESLHSMLSPVLTFNHLFGSRNGGLFPSGWDGKEFCSCGLLTAITSEECNMKKKDWKVSQSRAW